MGLGIIVENHFPKCIENPRPTAQDTTKQKNGRQHVQITQFEREFWYILGNICMLYSAKWYKCLSLAKKPVGYVHAIKWTVGKYYILVEKSMICQNISF